jgi:MFS family permease
LAPTEHTVATTVGWMQQLSSLGQFVAPPLVAWLASRAGGWQWTWVATGACSVLGVLLAARIAGEPIRR